MPAPLPPNTLPSRTKGWSFCAIDMWAASLGVAAAALALFVYLTSGDATGAALVLLLSAAVIAAALRISSEARGPA